MSTALEITVPLMILISLGICSLVRDYDLRNIARTTWISELPFTDWEMPAFGPFTLVHSLNYVLVFLAFAITLDPVEPTQLPEFFKGELYLHFILQFIVLLYLMFFPLLEVTEYQDIPPADTVMPDSMQNHFIFSASAILLLYLGDILYKTHGPPIEQNVAATFPIPLLQVLSLAGSMVLIALAIITFVARLADEIEAQTEPLE